MPSQQSALSRKHQQKLTMQKVEHFKKLLLHTKKIVNQTWILFKSLIGIFFAKKACRCFNPSQYRFNPSQYRYWKLCAILHYWLFSAPTHYQTKVPTTTSKFHSNDWSFNAPIHYQTKDPNYDIPLAMISFKLEIVIPYVNYGNVHT